MSRTFRYTNKGNKTLNQYAVSRHFSFTWREDTRNKNKAKGGAIIEGEEDFFVSVLNGHYQFGIPKDYRKIFNRQQKVKMKQNMIRQIRNEEFDEIGGEKLVKNAGYYYY